MTKSDFTKFSDFCRVGSSRVVLVHCRIFLKKMRLSFGPDLVLGSGWPFSVSVGPHKVRLTTIFSSTPPPTRKKFE